MTISGVSPSSRYVPARLVWATKATRVLYRVGLYLLVTVGAIAFGLPFLWMIRTTVMPSTQVFRFPPEWIPNQVVWHYYTDVFKYQLVGGVTFQRWIWNSFVLSTLSSIGVVVSSSIVGFSFARLRFPAKDVLFMVLLATMILPFHVRLIPTYLLFSKLNWVGTYKPLLVPMFFAPAFSVFLLRQFLMQIPREMDDSAYIDGCSPLGVYFRIHLPLSLPALGVTMIFQFNGMWNNFTEALLYLRDAPLYPVALGLRFYQGQFRETNIQLLMCASLISILPPIVLFFLAQRHMVQGIVITGVKG
jgi:ABC-type glycerol-3-phosphate transport system permease component